RSAQDRDRRPMLRLSRDVRARDPDKWAVAGPEHVLGWTVRLGRRSGAAVMSNELQHTAAWHQQRLGIPTASGIWKVLQRGRCGSPSVTRARYMAELIAARRATDEEPI